MQYLDLIILTSPNGSTDLSSPASIETVAGGNGDGSAFKSVKCTIRCSC